MVKKSLYFCLFILASQNVNAQETNSCEEFYEIDKTYTSIVWYADRMGYSKTIGRFAEFVGTIELNRCDVEKSKIQIKIDTKLITLLTPV